MVRMISWWEQRQSQTWRQLFLTPLMRPTTECNANHCLRQQQGWAQAGSKRFWCRYLLWWYSNWPRNWRRKCYGVQWIRTRLWGHSRQKQVEFFVQPHQESFRNQFLHLRCSVLRQRRYRRQQNLCKFEHCHHHSQQAAVTRREDW